MAAFTATPDQTRAQLYEALTRRNKVVAALRIAVPAAGAAIALVVLGGIVLDNLREQFGFASIRIDRDNLVVDTPKVTGTDDDGTLYSATALTAKVRLGSTEMIDMVDATFTMTPRSGATFTAAAPAAALNTAKQTLTVPGQMAVSSNDGLSGTLEDFYGDMLSWQMAAYGAVDLSFPGGMQIMSEGMTYDGNRKVWTFTRATMILPETPGDAENGAVPETSQ